MSYVPIAIKGINRDSIVNRSSGDIYHIVTNIEDSVVCTKSMESYDPQDSKVGVISFPCDFDHMYASLGEGIASSKEKNEYKHLKEICLQHLDLIQQQSEYIAQQEKQNQALRLENEALRQRLLRKDRHAGQQKCGSEIDCADGDTNSTRSHSRNTVRSPTSPRGSDVSKHFRHRNLGDLSSEGTCQSPFHWEDTSSRRYQSEDGLASMSSGCEMRDDSSSTTASRPSRALGLGSSSRGRKQRVKRSLSSGSQDTLATSASHLAIATPRRLSVKRSKKQETELSAGSASHVSSSVLTTSHAYYTATGGSDSNWSMDDLCPESEPDVNGDMLEIPQWRSKIYTSLYSMEGTENLDDEVFLKRHQRLELDERRRKRWDVQRIREQRHVEKLRQRESASSSAVGGTGLLDAPKEELISTLWPNPDDAEYLEVADELPVAAFGLPISKFSPSEFALPWIEFEELPVEDSTPPPPKQLRRFRGGGGRRKRLIRGRGGSRAAPRLPGRRRNFSERK